MTKITNMTVLFLGMLLLAFCAVVQGAGCDSENCQGAEPGNGLTIPCNANFIYNKTSSKCKLKDPNSTGTDKPNCLKSSTPPNGGEVNCDDCKCSVKSTDEDGTACKCRHKDLSGYVG